MGLSWKCILFAITDTTYAFFSLHHTYALSFYNKPWYFNLLEKGILTCPRPSTVLAVSNWLRYTKICKVTTSYHLVTTTYHFKFGNPIYLTPLLFIEQNSERFFQFSKSSNKLEPLSKLQKRNAMPSKKSHINKL